jgi:hypothetical protein
METAVQDQEFEIENPKSEHLSPTGEIAVLENSETGNVTCDAVTIDTSAYAGRPIERNLSAGQAQSPIWPYRR